MVVGKSFIWAHLGKTGGDSTHKMFSLINSGDLRIDKTNDRRKHVNFSAGAKRFNVSLAGRKRIMNIRRLPHWILSHNQHVTRRTSIDFSSEHLRKGLARHHDEDKSADQVLQTFESDKVDHWIRTEYLSSDFIKTMSEFMLIPQYVREKINSIWVNRAAYDKELGAWFDNDMLSALYDSNPCWRDLEIRLYGGLLPICNICGATAFETGPRGRMSTTGHAPRCSKCNSVERERICRSVFECFKQKEDLARLRVLQIGIDQSVRKEWFTAFDQIAFDQDRLPTPSELGIGNYAYDAIICNHVLQRVKDDRKALHELLGLLSPDGFVVLIFPAPTILEETKDWGFPDVAQHRHYRVYGADVEERFRDELNDAYVVRHTQKDPVTYAEERVYLICQSNHRFQQIVDALDNADIVCRPRGQASK